MRIQIMFQLSILTRSRKLKIDVIKHNLKEHKKDF